MNASRPQATTALDDEYAALWRRYSQCPCDASRNAIVVAYLDLAKTAAGRWLLESFGGVSRAIATAYWFGEKTMAEIASEYGYSESRVSQLMSQIEGRIRLRYRRELAGG
jgi:AraC-like DNA-binding protein